MGNLRMIRSLCLVIVTISLLLTLPCGATGPDEREAESLAELSLASTEVGDHASVSIASAPTPCLPETGYIARTPQMQIEHGSQDMTTAEGETRTGEDSSVRSCQTKTPGLPCAEGCGRAATPGVSELEQCVLPADFAAADNYTKITMLQGLATMVLGWKQEFPDPYILEPLADAAEQLREVSVAEKRLKLEVVLLLLTAASGSGESITETDGEAHAVDWDLAAGLDKSSENLMDRLCGAKDRLVEALEGELGEGVVLV